MPSLSSIDVVHLHWPHVADPVDWGGDPGGQCFGVVVEQVCGMLMLLIVVRLMGDVRMGVEGWESKVGSCGKLEGWPISSY